MQATGGNKRKGVPVKSYVIAIAVGLLVGIIYGALKVRSPAPPVIALLGLLGILIGEQLPSLISRMAKGEAGGLSLSRQANEPDGAARSSENALVRHDKP